MSLGATLARASPSATDSWWRTHLAVDVAVPDADPHGYGFGRHLFLMSVVGSWKLRKVFIFQVVMVT